MTGKSKRLLTLDANVFVGSAKGDEPYREQCLDLLKLTSDAFILSEPSIVYEEVCGTIARSVGGSETREFSEKLDRLISSELLFDCDRSFLSFLLFLLFGIPNLFGRRTVS